MISLITLMIDLFRPHRRRMTKIMYETPYWTPSTYDQYFHKDH